MGGKNAFLVLSLAEQEWVGVVVWLQLFFLNLICSFYLCVLRYDAGFIPT